MLDRPRQPSDARAIDLPMAERTQPGSPLDARWSDDGSRILVARTVDPRPWPRADAARPDIGALLVLGGCLFLAIGIARIVRRPRVDGRAYCRRCNHDLNADRGARPVSAHCPECGLELGARGMVRGASRTRRVAGVLVPSTAALAAGLWLFAGAVAGPRARSSGVAWPVAAASKVPGWPWMRTSTVDSPARWALRVDVVRLVDGRLTLEAQGAIPGSSQQWLASPDGATIAWVEDSEDTGWVPIVNWFESGSGRTASAEIGPVHAGFPSLCGWTGDGGEIVALLQRPGAGYPQRDDGTAIVHVDVVAVDPRTGTVRASGSGRGHATGNANAWTLGPAIAAIGSASPPRTITVNAEQAGARSGAMRGELVLHELTVSDGPQSTVVPLGGAIVPGAFGFRRAALREDGRVAIEFVTSAWSDGVANVRDAWWFIDPATGAIEHAPSAPPESEASAARGCLSPDGARRMRLELEWPSPGCLGGIRVVVTDA